VATHLAVGFDPANDLHVDLFDPGGTLGRGIAYSTTDPQHLLNVPAKGMSLFRDDMTHFQKWAGAEPDEFVPRVRYGEYVQGALRGAWRRRNGRLHHVRQQIVDLLPAGDGTWYLIDSAGQRHEADVVVLATGHQTPEAPHGIQQDVVEAEGFFEDPWSHAALADIGPDEHIVCLGTGLTFVDVALTALAANPQVRVTGVSRRGRLPSRHLVPLTVPRAPMPLKATGTVDIETVIEHVLSAGRDWRGAIDGLRSQTPAIWQRLSDEDRDFFMRHLARDWDVLRHRMAPGVAETIRAHRRSGRLRIEPAPHYRVDHLGERFVVGTQRRAMVVDRVIVCTGPRADVRTSGLGSRLVQRGIARPGPFAIGFDVDPETGELIAGDGTPVENVFTIGPLRRGVLFESTAMPEIALQAQRLAELVRRRSVVPQVTVSVS
jgi:uncharacterized NAD(P)/FAD-binding protein YdhS